VVPVTMTDTSVELAICDIIDPAVMDELMFVLTCDVSFVLAREDDVRACINQFYGDDSAAVNDIYGDIDGRQVDDARSQVTRHHLQHRVFFDQTEINDNVAGRLAGFGMLVTDVLHLFAGENALLYEQFQ